MSGGQGVVWQSGGAIYDWHNCPPCGDTVGAAFCNWHMRWIKYWTVAMVPPLFGSVTVTEGAPFQLAATVHHVFCVAVQAVPLTLPIVWPVTSQGEIGMEEYPGKLMLAP